MDTKDHSRAAREVKRYLLQIVRNDWDWPPDQKPAADGTTPDVTAHALENQEPVAYKERYYGSTDDSALSEEEEEEGNDEGHDKDNISGAEDVGKKEAYRFDSPDAVGGMLEEQAQRRKRKRRKMLEEEMRYNTGMRCFIERRNAWTAAKRRSGDKNRTTMEKELKKDRDDASDTESADDLSIAETATSANDPDAIDPSRFHPSNLVGPGPANRASNEPAYGLPIFEGVLPDADPLIPVPPPLVSPDNFLRKSLTPKTYPEIYSKIVLGSRTPTIPINLSDMTHALVQGWKDSGEWPPRSSALEPAMAGRRSRATAKLEAVIGLDGHEQVQQSNGIGEGLFAHHPHFRRGVEGMKRVLRLSSHEHKTGVDAG